VKILMDAVPWRVVLATVGESDAAPPVLHTLHGDLRRNADFSESVAGWGRVFFAEGNPRTCASS
jgi:hypothetical protein